MDSVNKTSAGAKESGHTLGMHEVIPSWREIFRMLQAASSGLPLLYMCSYAVRGSLKAQIMVTAGINVVYVLKLGSREW